MVNPDERERTGALRERLGVAGAQRLVGVMHAGHQGELATLLPDAQTTSVGASRGAVAT